MTRTQTHAGGTAGFSNWRPVDFPLEEPCKTGLHVGPHNRCNHATAFPSGFVGCAGDPGCPYRIPIHLAKLGWTRCPWHAELSRPYSVADGMHELMGGPE